MSIEIKKEHKTMYWLEMSEFTSDDDSEDDEEDNSEHFLLIRNCSNKNRFLALDVTSPFKLEDFAEFCIRLTHFSRLATAEQMFYALSKIRGLTISVLDASTRPDTQAKMEVLEWKQIDNNLLSEEQTEVEFMKASYEGGKLQLTINA